MRPYLAVIADSFRSAFASRILWIAFLAIWLFLIALAPIGYREDYTTAFRWFDLDNGTQMKAMLARGLVDPKENKTALGRVARSFPEAIKSDLRQVAKGEDVRIQKRALADALNQALDDESWYDEEAWDATIRLRELRELDELSGDELEESLRRRRARLRIEAALPGVFAAQSARSIILSYAGFDFPATYYIGKEQFISLINQFVVPIIMDWLLGFALIFLGILVTASIIPDMLQPGSLHLLLSKPISRNLLLLSKFVGGCAFFFLCVCQLVIGLYLIAGFRLDIWNPRMLWCIPVAVFLFTVFYSVSLLAGLCWRSPTLSIGITCMFGALVLVIGMLGGYFDGLVTRPDRIGRMAFDGQDLIIATRGDELKKFDRESNQWKEVIEGNFRSRDLIIPPVTLEPGKVASARIQGGRFNLYGSGSLDLLVFDGGDDWEPHPSLRLPTGTRRLFVSRGWLLALNNAGLMATPVAEALAAAEDAVADGVEDAETPRSVTEAGESEDEEEAGQADPGSIGVTAWISDLLRMQGGATDEFHSVLPEGVTLSDPTSVVGIPGTGTLVVYSRGRLMRLELPGVPQDKTQRGKVVATLAADRTLDEENVSRAVIAASGGSLMMIRGDEPVRWFNLEDLSELAESPLPDDQPVMSAVGMCDGLCFATLAEDGRVRVASRSEGRIRWNRWRFKDVTAIAYDTGLESLAVAHRVDSIDWVRPRAGDGAGIAGEADPALQGETVRSVDPTLQSWRSVDRYLVTPLRTVTPQTGELSETVAVIVGGKATLSMGNENSENREVVRLKVARPVLSCGIFVLAMLGGSCLYFSRRDF